MTSKATYKSKDFGGEATRFGVATTQMTAANFDAQIALIEALQTAANNVALHTFSGLAVNARNDLPGAQATDEYAQREAKWRVTYTDDVVPEGDGSFEIPMPDLTLLVPGSGLMNIAAGAGAALVTAIEAVVLSRLGNAVTVTTIAHVGRNI